MTQHKKDTRYSNTGYRVTHTKSYLRQVPIYYIT